MSNKYRYEPSNYMYWVTDNVDTFVPNKKNQVACVFCVAIFETCAVDRVHGCLVCKQCGVDALMVVAHSPLLEMSDEDRMKKLIEWHKQGFSALGRFVDEDAVEDEIIVFKGLDYYDAIKRNNLKEEEQNKARYGWGV